MIFREGEWYNFTVTKEIDVPGNGKQFILTHESGKKLLLSAQYYVKYNISENSSIQCRVDKINCTGQIFIEPAHPVYKIGNIYNFKIKKIVDSLIDEVQSLIVSDIFGNEVEVLFPKGTIDEGQTEVKLKVLGIKKGVPILSASAKWDFCPDTFSSGQEILLLLSKVVVIQNEEYYLLKAKNCIALLKVKHYKHYGFKEGIPIVAKYRGTDARGLLLVDPEHPFYKVGRVYQFEIAAIEEAYSNELGSSSRVAVVYDKFGMKCGVRIENASSYRIGKSVICKVIGYKKGRPLLEIVPM